MRTLNLGLGRAAGQLHFTGAVDAVKHVAAGGESAADAEGGGCRGVGLGSGEAPLDAVPAGEAPALFTLDVEGDAAEVLAAVSANLTLAAPGLMAW